MKSEDIDLSNLLKETTKEILDTAKMTLVEAGPKPMNLKTSDKVTFDSCDNCNKEAKCRFFEVRFETGGQVAAWGDLPPGWMFLPFDGYTAIACSEACALKVTEQYAAELKANYEKANAEAVSEGTVRDTSK